MIEEAIPLFPIVGRVDAEGRLIEADPPLAALHAQTGGKPGGMLAIPQLAALVRLGMIMPNSMYDWLSRRNSLRE